MLHKLAWLQLIAERRRLMAALAGIAFAVLLQLMQFGFRDALFSSAVTLHSRLRGDLIVVSTQYEYALATGSITERRLHQARSLPAVQAVAPVYLGVAPFKNVATGEERRIFVVGVDPAASVLDIPGLGVHAPALKAADVVVFDGLSRKDFGPVVETFGRDGVVTTELAGRRTDIVGLFEMGVSFAANGHIIASPGTFRSLFRRPEGIVELGVVTLRPGSDPLAAQAELRRRLPRDVQVLTLQEFIDTEKSFWDKSSPIGFIFLMGTFIGLLVGAVIVYQILYTDVTDHLGEYATLKAMGYSDYHFYFVVLEEAMILSVAGFPIGFGLALLLYSAARNATNLPVTMTVSRAVLVFALTLAMCGIAGVIATRKLRSADPAEVF